MSRAANNNDPRQSDHEPVLGIIFVIAFVALVFSGAVHLFKENVMPVVAEETESVTVRHTSYRAP